MSEAEEAFDTTRRDERYYGVREFDDGWAIKLFAVRVIGAPLRDLAIETMEEVVGRLLRSITTRMSPEFEYGRFGTVIVHMGRRGLCITAIHFGGWGSTFE